MTQAMENDVMKVVLEHGQSSTSFITTYPGFRHFDFAFLSGSIRISYIETGTAWVGASEPLGNSEGFRDALIAFIAAARAKKKVALLLPVSKDIAQIARSLDLGTIQIGQEPWFKLSEFPIPKIAKQLENKGARVESFQPAHLSARERFELEEITNRWLGSRKSAPLDFLNQVKPWVHIQQKKYFRVFLNEHQLGYLSAIPVPKRKAWYLIDLIRIPSSPLGTTELLIASAVTALSKEGAVEMTLGMSPFAEVDENEFQFHPNLYTLLRFVFEKMSFFYNFKSLYQYKEKLKPNHWEPLYLITSEKSFGLRSSLGLSQAIFPSGITATAWLTLKKLISRLSLFAGFSRFLSDDLVVRSRPKQWSDTLFRLKVTLSIAFINILFFIGSTSEDFQLRDAARDRFQFNIARFMGDGFGHDDLRALLLHSFLHWNLFHLLFNMTTLLIFLGYLEMIAGSVLVLIAYLLGILFSNPLTSLLLEPILHFLNPAISQAFIHENDVGCSLGVFAGLGALSYLLKKPSYFLGFLTLGTAIVSLANTSILGLNHLVALAIGYGVSKHYVPKNEL